MKRQVSELIKHRKKEQYFFNGRNVDALSSELSISFKYSSIRHYRHRAPSCLTTSFIAEKDKSNRFFNPELGGGSLLDVGHLPDLSQLFFIGQVLTKFVHAEK